LFSGTIDPKSLQSTSPVLVLDAAGNSWPAIVSSYGGYQVGFAFRQPLPPGKYTIVDRLPGGLTDLTGRVPVAPGQNPGVLATFIVSPQVSRPVAGDLGVLWPNSNFQLSQFATISPGQEAVSRVVVLASGFYSFYTTFDQGSVEISRVGPDGVTSIGTSTGGPYISPAMLLYPGVYLFSLRAFGALPAVYQWQFQFSLIDHEWTLNNGVGQASAISLRLISTDTTSLSGGAQPGTNPVVPRNDDPAVVTPSPQSGSSFNVISAPVAIGEPLASTGVSVIPTSLVVTVNTGLLGTPSLQNEPVAVVGPVVAGGSIALAGNFADLPPGIIHLSSGSNGQNAPVPTDSAPALEVSPATAAGWVDTGTPSSAVSGLPLSVASTADAQALIKADRIMQLVGSLGRWIGLKTGEEEMPFDNAPDASVLLARSPIEPGRHTPDTGTGPLTERTTEADLGMPIGLILGAAAAYRLRQFAGGWWRSARGQVWAPSRPKAMPLGHRTRSFRGIHASHARRGRARTARRS
jgi:hypothetical protein